MQRKIVFFGFCFVTGLVFEQFLAPEVGFSKNLMVWEFSGSREYMNSYEYEVYKFQCESEVYRFTFESGLYNFKFEFELYEFAFESELYRFTIKTKLNVRSKVHDTHIIIKHYNRASQRARKFQEKISYPSSLSDYIGYPQILSIDTNGETMCSRLEDHDMRLSLR
ncbi:hypothetical protein LXL04_019768 [Taraxacum kok-saghyz]